MKDKKGKELKIGDKVKFFTYLKGTIIEFKQYENEKEEMAVVVDSEEKGRWTLYKEEFQLKEW